MPVSRKNKSTKKSSKSSKHSKNVKRNKKTRKNMKKMRGGVINKGEFVYESKTGKYLGEIQSVFVKDSIPKIYWINVGQEKPIGIDPDNITEFDEPKIKWIVRKVKDTTRGILTSVVSDALTKETNV